MTEPENDDAEFLRSHVEGLPRSIEPPHNLWPGIEARIAPRRRAAPALYRLAAAIALVAISSSITWYLTRRTATPVVVAVAPANPEALARLARAGDILEDGIDNEGLAPETRAVLARNLVVIDSAIAECQRALDADPGSPVLAELLRAAHRQRVELLQQAARLPRT